MELSERIKLLDQLGKFLIGYCNNHATNRKDIFFSKLHSALKKSQISNPYFEKANIKLPKTPKQGMFDSSLFFDKYFASF